MKKGYGKFLGMILTSAILMDGVMYLNIYKLYHVFFREMRLYITILLTAFMAVVMLGFMFHMLKDKKINISILVVSILVFTSSFYLMRNQTTIDDVDYMEGIIPHHSIAILKSVRTNIEDPRVRKLAGDIIETQEKEIKEMKELIKDIKK